VHSILNKLHFLFVSGGVRGLRLSDKENARPAQVTLTQTTQQQLQILLSAADSDSEENGDEPELNNRLSKCFKSTFL
jgi:hypothetical protein